MAASNGNIGEADLAIRFVVGLLLVGAALGLHDAGNTPASMQPWGWIGLYPLATVLSGRCWIYRWLGVDTRARSKTPD